MIYVVGLDLSLTSTGVAIVADEKGTVPAVDRITSTGRKVATLADRAARLRDLAARILNHCAPADLVAVEGPSFGQQRQGGQHDRVGLWWLLVSKLHARGVPVVEIPPALVKRYATGKGNAPKDAVLAAVVRRYPDVEVTGNDEADALVLAAMASRHLGVWIDDMPKTHLAAMDKVAWPGRST